MPWKQGYTISDERSIADSELRWPDGARCCVSVTVDLAPPCGPEGITAADLKSPEAHYGMHGALDVLLDVLRKHAVKATFAVPAVTAHSYPDRLRALAGEGHEIAAHGWKREDVSTLGRAEEKARLDRTTEVIAGITGARPDGWFTLPRQGDKYAGGGISPHTVDLLLEAGYGYLGNGLADDVPHWWVSDFATRRAILTLPYYYHYDDQFFLLFPAKGTGLEHADALYRNWVAEFDAQYARGRHFGMTLHPYAIGFPNRLKLLDDFLTYARSFPALWNPTGSALARHWTEAFPAATHLKLEPSIWQDYPGSLS